MAPSDNLNSDVQFWNPDACLRLGDDPEQSYAVIVLNRPILFSPQFLIPFWNKAVVRITVDGGTNRWNEYLKCHSNSECVEPLPMDFISGDFDSINEATLNVARENGIVIYETVDQNETDFTKSLRVLNRYRILNNIKFNNIFVLCQSSGRLDQIMANINTLYKSIYQPIVPSETSIYVLSNDSISWLLNSGEHSIIVPTVLQHSNRVWCGLIPIGQKCSSITTKGLKWNLDNSVMEFGHLVSTSNKLDGSDRVTIKTSSPILWCMNLLPLLNAYYNTDETED